MNRPTLTQNFTAGLILLIATVWAVFGYGVWRLLRAADGLNDLGGPSGD